MHDNNLISSPKSLNSLILHILRDQGWIYHYLCYHCNAIISAISVSISSSGTSSNVSILVLYSNIFII